MVPTIKAKFNNKTKGISSSKVKDYQSLVNTIKSQFTQLKQPFKMYYNENDTKICIDDQEDYNNIDFNTNLYIYITYQMGYEDISRIQSSKNRSRDNLDDSVLNIIANSTLQQSGQVVILSQKELQEKPIKTSKHQKLNRSQKFIMQQETKTKILIKLEKSVQKESSQYIKAQIQSPTAINNCLESFSNQYKVQCANCKPILTVQKWKCPSKNGFDFDVCQKCYDEDRQKSKYVVINDESYWSKINYTHAIAKIFDSKYSKQKQIDSLEEIEWISQQDILQKRPNFIKRVQDCSDHIVTTIISNFNKWQRDYQRNPKQIKSK